MIIRIGTAGWSIPREVAASLSGAGTHLERYSRLLRCAEVNTSFYRSHRPQAYARWAAQTPRAFQFAVKMPQQITHENHLRRARKPLQQFLAELQGLGRRLGPILVQLPPSLEFDRRAGQAFFGMLRELHDGPVACEPRHASWFDDRADALLDRNQVARVAADPAPHPAGGEPGGWPGLVYFRLHGSPRRYWSVYDHGRLATWAQAMLKSGADASWCIFDNTAGSGAAQNALELAALVTRRRPD